MENVTDTDATALTDAPFHFVTDDALKMGGYDMYSHGYYRAHFPAQKHKADQVYIACVDSNITFFIIYFPLFSSYGMCLFHLLSITLSIVMLSIITLSIITLSIITLSIITLSIITLSII